MAGELTQLQSLFVVTPPLSTEVLYSDWAGGTPVALVFDDISALDCFKFKILLWGTGTSSANAHQISSSQVASEFVAILGCSPRSFQWLPASAMFFEIVNNPVTNCLLTGGYANFLSSFGLMINCFRKNACLKLSEQFLLFVRMLVTNPKGHLSPSKTVFHFSFEYVPALTCAFSH